jgi:hypothetical protein
MYQSSKQKVRKRIIRRYQRGNQKVLKGIQKVPKGQPKGSKGQTEGTNGGNQKMPRMYPEGNNGVTRMYKGLSECTKKQSEGMKRKFRRYQTGNQNQMGHQKVSTE